MKRLRDIPLHLRLLGMVALLVAGFVLIVGNMLQTERQHAVDARVAQLRAIVQTALGIAGSLHDEEKAGRLTHDAALISFRSALHAMRYGNGDYIFSYSNDGTVLALPPQPSVEGVNRIDMKDPSGRSVIRELIDTAAKGGGVIGSSYPRPGTTTPVPKLNYVAPFAPWNIFVASGVFVDDLNAEARAALIRTGIIAGLAIGIAASLAWLLGRSVSRPLSRLERAMTALAAGDLSVSVAFAGRGDEIGRMARAVQVFKTTAADKHAMEAARIRAEDAAHADHRRVAGETADRLQGQLGNVAAALEAASGHLTATATELRGATELASAEAVSAKQLVEGASSNVGMVASAAEQLAGSVSEISAQVAKSTTIAVRAVDEAQRTDGLVQALAETATKIGGVIEVITRIAGQTNLLALNATIEAARADDAGKGFAVVASEVKSLANQTAKATGEIAAQIEHIQAATRDAVAAIGNIGSTISEISQLSGCIAAAVEQQRAATEEISRNVRQAASGTAEVAARISTTSGAVAGAGGSAEAVQNAAEALSGQSRTLSEQLVRLVEQVRAA